jgi:hypothetical protein
MTLGAFTGYFRERGSTKNCTFPYNSYSGHFVLGVIYSQVINLIDERKVYSIDHLECITSVVKDFYFFVQEKFKIANDRPGSGNTKNIGSVVKLSDLINGTGPFAQLGEDVFNDYWSFFLTEDMAKAADLPKRPYTNIETYLKFKGVNK